MRSVLSTDVDHDNNVLTSQEEFQPIERYGAGIGDLPPSVRAALPQSSGMFLVVAILILLSAPQPG